MDVFAFTEKKVGIDRSAACLIGSILCLKTSV